jgi:hypothetical protein
MIGRWIPAVVALVYVPACAFWGMSDWSDSPVVAQDTFTRTLDSGMGQADLGGVWKLSTQASTYAVRDGVAHFTLDTPGRSVESYLLDISALDVDATASFTTTKAPDGNGISATLAARIVMSGDYSYYKLTVRIAASSTASIQLGRRDGTVLIQEDAAQISNVPGRIIHLRLQVAGRSPSHLRGRVWMDDDAEPSAWDLEADDSSAILQSAGGAGLVAYLSEASTIGPVIATFDDFAVRAVTP